MQEWKENYESLRVNISTIHFNLANIWQGANKNKRYQYFFSWEIFFSFHCTLACILKHKALVKKTVMIYVKSSQDLNVRFAIITEQKRVFCKILHVGFEIAIPQSLEAGVRSILISYLDENGVVSATTFFYLWPPLFYLERYRFHP